MVRWAANLWLTVKRIRVRKIENIIAVSPNVSSVGPPGYFDLLVGGVKVRPVNVDVMV